MQADRLALFHSMADIQDSGLCSMIQCSAACSLFFRKFLVKSLRGTKRTRKTFVILVARSRYAHVHTKHRLHPQSISLLT